MKSNNLSCKFPTVIYIAEKLRWDFRRKYLNTAVTCHYCYIVTLYVFALIDI